ncbi:hypothetical protein [Microbacterium sp. gxy059]|uniref:hypothetical protein n=1 Tax=Microbacterium sp. gxy059 TaxID=2957199 RepID=UPI003D97ED1C
MEWTSDVSAGDWIRERMGDSADPGITGGIVPSGFAAYARVLHPVYRERPVGVAWPREEDPEAWETFLAAAPEIESERVTWATAAERFGTTMHPEAQWFRLVGAPHADEAHDLRDADGWRYGGPEEGRLEPETLAAVARRLIAHTETPDAGFAAIWEGWGDLLGARKPGHPSDAHFGFAPEGSPARYAQDPRHESLLGKILHDPFWRPFRRQRWHPGVLSDEVSRGPRLELPGRGHVLFRAAPAEWTDPAWADRVPWARPGWAEQAESPSLIWPEDRAWILASEIDLDSTIVGGSADLIRALVDAPDIEAHEIAPDADLTWDGDRINAPR